MKRKRILIASAIVLLFITLVTAVSVIAADGDTTTQPKSVKSGGIELESKRFPISRYQANNEASDEMLKGPFVGLTNVTFSFAGNIVRVVDTGMDIMYNLKPIDEFADAITNVSKTVYNTLKKNFGEALFILTCGYVVYLFLVRGSAKEAMRRSILFILVLVIGGLWMSNAGYYMKALNALSVEAQGKLLKAGNGLVGIVRDEGNFSDSSKIEKGKEMEGTIAVMRNVYFDIALKKPYLIVNYDQTNEKKINEEGNEKDKLNRIDKLLSFKLSKEGEEAKLKYIKETEVDKNNNDALSSGNVFNQLGESFIAVIASIVIGIPFLALAFLNFLLQIIALAIVFFIPFAFIIGYIPQLAFSGFVTLGRLGSIYLLKAMLGILILFVYVMCFIVDTLVPPNGFGMYLLNVVVLASILWLGFKKRDSIIKFVTAGRVVSVDNNMMENARKDIVQPSWEAAKKGANSLSGSFTQFGKVFGNRKGTSSGDTGNDSNEMSHDNTGSESRGLVTGMDKKAISRTPQKNDKTNPIPPNKDKQLDRNLQTLRKEQPRLLPNDQQKNIPISDMRKDGVKAPMLNDVLKEGKDEEYKRAPVLQERMSEKERSDQREFMDRNNHDRQPEHYEYDSEKMIQKEDDENTTRAPLAQEIRTENERTDQTQFSEREHRGKGYEHQMASVQREYNETPYTEAQKETRNTSENKQVNSPVRPSEPSSKIQSDGFSAEKKQTVSSGENRFVNREVAKKVIEKPVTLNRNHSIEKADNLSLNDIVSRSSSKGEDRLRRDERS
ncbi:CD3337/EF1877 family mobilome membrane protein [Bacillus atrophaeus]|uniref:CD3337/EF1877 family mobilome membrane protein n=1 Tax=Bacillus atrophaeus TaxID=1452 RepID=UPI002DBDBD26|nr:hypothetical protein [Bacillus atrophaeus]MEC1900721.1 hypothetical protein [Bacillus atrophaeus]MEC2396556.1 hypothetical protein [Bacillus atrophaeus]MED4436211.1 hypothetical protein [Bacillus atrophaeus]MED4563817.1 hypothetical protein [Bacillus atrophaeus]MED4575142.1 hypothetical protein [Bacillus atrophaeus]